MKNILLILFLVVFSISCGDPVDMQDCPTETKDCSQLVTVTINEGECLHVANENWRNNENEYACFDFDLSDGCDKICTAFIKIRPDKISGPITVSIQAIFHELKIGSSSQLDPNYDPYCSTTSYGIDYGGGPRKWQNN